MRQRFKPYSDYEESGVAWIGDMPSHWGLQRTKTFFNRMQRPVRPKDGIVTAFRDGEVTLRSNRRTDGFTNAAKEIGYQGVRVDDLVVHAMDGFAGAIGVSDSDGKCSPVYSVCTPKEKNNVHVAYYGYLVRQLAVTDFINSLAKGIRERSTEFRYSEFSILRLAVPPIEEQKQIASFLDYETGKIDALIAMQQQLIALLGEKRQAVISHAVTKGLNPDAPMRDSGVQWLGQVPEHWKALPLKYLCGLLKDGTHLPPPRVSEGVPLLSVRNIQNGKFSFRNDDSQISEASYSDLCRAFVPATDDVFMAIVGATLGKVAVVPKMDRFHIQRSLAILRTKKELMLSRYLAGVLSSQGFQDLLWENVGFSAQPGIYLGTIENFRVPVPPVEEQLAICGELDRKSETMDVLIDKAVRSVELLRERRTALISAAVTGKIDVRGWKPPSADPKQQTEMEVA